MRPEPGISDAGAQESEKRGDRSEDHQGSHFAAGAEGGRADLGAGGWCLHDGKKACKDRANITVSAPTWEETDTGVRVVPGETLRRPDVGAHSRGPVSTKSR